MFYRSNILAGLVALAAVALTAGHWLNMATAKSTDEMKLTNAKVPMKANRMQKPMPKPRARVRRMLEMG